MGDRIAVETSKSTRKTVKNRFRNYKELYCSCFAFRKPNHSKSSSESVDDNQAPFGIEFAFKSNVETVEADPEERASIPLEE